MSKKYTPSQVQRAEAISAVQLPSPVEPARQQDSSKQQDLQKPPQEVVITLDLSDLKRSQLLKLSLWGLAGVMAAAPLLSTLGPPLRTQLASIGATSYATWLALTAIVLAATVWYTYSKRGVLTGMTGMMSGMTFGMMSGLMVGAIFGATNGMFIGSVVGMLVGMGIGTVSGCCEGLMGTMEGLMAGLMGGLMGAMLTVMLRYDNLDLFLPILFAAFLLILGLIVLMVYRASRDLACAACEPDLAQGQTARGVAVTRGPRPGLVALPIGLATFSLVFIMAFGPRSSYLGLGNITGTPSSPPVAGTNKAAPINQSSTTVGSAAPAPTTGTATRAPITAPAPPSTSAKLGPNDAAAVVGGERITMTEVNQRVELQLAMQRAAGGSDASYRAQLDQLQASTVTEMVEERMLAQEAARQGIIPTNAEVNDFLTNNVFKQLNITEDKLKAELVKANLTLDYLREVLKKYAAADKLINTVVLKDIPPDQRKSTYDAWFSNLQSKAQVTVNLKTDTVFPSAPQTSARAGGQVEAQVKGGVQEINMTASAGGYSPTVIKVKKGIPVRLNITTDGTAACARVFVFPAFKISKTLPAQGTETIEFTPDRDGPLTFSCGMGMFRGQMIVEQG
ncbi:MAG: hypothetical protein EXR62_13445 [Chloroflexi bacterium]|nr:hypothetical protein [Chloroflexota bacterium]